MVKIQRISRLHQKFTVTLYENILSLDGLQIKFSIKYVAHGIAAVLGKGDHP